MTPQLITNSELRLASYKLLLSQRFDLEWFRDSLRESKNSEEAWLSKLREERTFEKQGLNPPFCYEKP